MSTLITKPTNITKLKCLEYTCLRNCNVEDVKNIDLNLHLIEANLHIINVKY